MIKSMVVIFIQEILPIYRFLFQMFDANKRIIVMRQFMNASICTSLAENWQNTLTCDIFSEHQLGFTLCSNTTHAICRLDNYKIKY